MGRGWGGLRLVELIRRRGQMHRSADQQRWPRGRRSTGPGTWRTTGSARTPGSRRAVGDERCGPTRRQPAHVPPSGSRPTAVRARRSLPHGRPAPWQGWLPGTAGRERGPGARADVLSSTWPFRGRPVSGSCGATGRRRSVGLGQSRCRRDRNGRDRPPSVSRRLRCGAVASSVGRVDETLRVGTRGPTRRGYTRARGGEAGSFLGIGTAPHPCVATSAVCPS